MAIFDPAFTPATINAFGSTGMPAWLGMECLEIGEDFMRMRMPVDHRTHQPHGLLHGGASVALGETIGGVCSAAVLGARSDRIAVGLEINANHVRSVREGHVIATCRPLHLGRNTHVWDIRVESVDGKLVSVIRLTNAIVPRPVQGAV